MSYIKTKISYKCHSHIWILHFALKLARVFTYTEHMRHLLLYDHAGNSADPNHERNDVILAVALTTVITFVCTVAGMTCFLKFYFKKSSQPWPGSLS